jgi:hypothetical protein
MGKPIANITREQLEELYVRQGESGLSVARLLGVGQTTIFRHLKRHGIHAKSQSEVRAAKHWSPGEDGKKRMSEMAKSQTGENSPVWKGGRSWTGRDKEHSYAIIRVNGKYVKEHRYVMSQHLGRKLARSEYVHHINGDRRDNRIENLEILSNSEHTKLHMANPEIRKKISERVTKLRSERFWSSKKK